MQEFARVAAEREKVDLPSLPFHIVFASSVRPRNFSFQSASSDAATKRLSGSTLKISSTSKFGFVSHSFDMLLSDLISFM